jgi:NAD(P)-dependent dehydrogenase (short-subunit alcohol dehydrogenase family)
MLRIVLNCGVAFTCVIASVLTFKIYSQMQANEVQYEVSGSGYVLVTGASSGIGQHMALHLARKYPGLIVLAGVRKESDATIVRDFQQPNLRPLIVDVASEASCRGARATINQMCENEKLPFLALVNNAGVARRYPAEFHDVTDAQGIFAANFWGAFMLTQQFLPLLRASKGRIINISSIAEFTGTPMNSVYVASKTAMGGWSDALRREIAHFNVSVSVVQPAYIKSAIFETAKKAAQAIDAKQQAGPAHSTASDADANTSAVHKYYAHFFDAKAMAALEAEITADASDPIVVSEAVEHALLSPFPRTRYAVGKVAGIPAWVCAWIRWALTDRAVDKLITPVP